ncbi:hypothetical protein ACN20G_17965 [Streptomyces sp. BI20]|uniref:SCO2584 family spore wall biosynthesis protein n=1 Tax=Streptomyces sp. BI20 TaxID=3403460 RepID=UPI003C74EA40
MPDDVGGKPFPDDGTPDDDRGGAGQDFASVVFDEVFVQNARIHEPSAAERLRAAEAARAVAGGRGADEDHTDPWDPCAPGTALIGFDGYGTAFAYGYGPYGAYGGALRPYRGRSRWLRPVAWVLAVVIGVGMVSLAFVSVYRGNEAAAADPGPVPAGTPLAEVPGRAAFTHPVTDPP